MKKPWMVHRKVDGSQEWEKKSKKKENKQVNEMNNH
jgi:hypothetical protein